MSLNRLIYYSAVIGGWAALLGWFVAEFLVLRTKWFGEGVFAVVLMAALVGAAVGGGLNLVAGMANASWREQVKRLAPGLLIGGIGGALGGLLGNLLFAYAGLPRAFGWLLMGVSIGAVDGLFDRAWKKVRNGLIGGALGGLIGGFLFEPIQRLASSPTGMASRAIAFVLLGVSIGALIGLVQVVLKEAWLTVLDGYRPGRQLILSRETTSLGRAENANLPFFGPTAQTVEKQHATIVRQSDGRFVLEDLGTKNGTRVNSEPVQGRRVLRDGDRIQMGGNLVRFSERQRAAAPPAPAPTAIPATSAPAAIPVARVAPAPVAKPALAAMPPSVPAPAPPAAPAPRSRAPDECPTCGRKVLGAPGRRRCMIDGTTF
jgi:hypothetical protein